MGRIFLAVTLLGFSLLPRAEPLEATARLDDGVITFVSAAVLSSPLRLALVGHAEPLAVLSVAGRQVRARLPASIADGSYRIRLHNGAAEDFQEANLVVGVVGPAIDEKH